jgi:transposase
MEEFRDFYSLKTGKNTEKEEAKKALNVWYKNVENSQIEEMLNFSYTVKRNEPEIMAYFFTNATNAIAESLNAKIQRFLISSFGIKNRDFFHFRMRNYFAPD